MQWLKPGIAETRQCKNSALQKLGIAKTCIAETVRPPTFGEYMGSGRQFQESSTGSLISHLALRGAVDSIDGGVMDKQESRRRIVGDERDTLAQEYVRRYEAGDSIRAIANASGRSYGFVHRVLAENEVQWRQRGGNTKRGSKTD